MNNNSRILIGANYFAPYTFSTTQFVIAKLLLFFVSFIIYKFFHISDVAEITKSIFFIISLGLLFVPIIMKMIENILAYNPLNDYLLITASILMLIIFDYKLDAYRLSLFFSIYDFLTFLIYMKDRKERRKISNFNLNAYRVLLGDITKKDARIVLSENEICPFEATVIKGNCEIINPFNKSITTVYPGDIIISGAKVQKGLIEVSALCDFEDSYINRCQNELNYFYKLHEKKSLTDIVLSLFQIVSLLMILVFTILKNFLGDEQGIIVFSVVAVTVLSLSSSFKIFINMMYNNIALFFSKQGVIIKSKKIINFLSIYKEPNLNNIEEMNQVKLEDIRNKALKIITQRTNLLTDATSHKEGIAQSDLAIATDDPHDIFDVIGIIKKFKVNINVFYKLKYLIIFCSSILYLSTLNFAAFLFINLIGQFIYLLLLQNYSKK